MGLNTAKEANITAYICMQLAARYVNQRDAGDLEKAEKTDELLHVFLDLFHKYERTAHVSPSCVA